MSHFDGEDCEPKNYLTENENYLFNDFSRIIEEDGYSKLKFPFSDELVKNEDNNSDRNYFKSSSIDPFLSINSLIDYNSLTGKTELTTINHFPNKIVNDDEKKEIKFIKKRGRKGNKGTLDNNVVHDKFTDDNVIRKIKTAIFQYILIELNNSLENKFYKFFPLNAELNKNLNRDLNVKLLDKTIRQIYMSENLNGHHINDNDSNKNLIKKILNEKVEIKTIKILNMKFSEILNHIREKDLTKFMKIITDKEEKKKEESFDSYVESVTHYLSEYENWFKKIKGRNTKKRIKK